MGSRFTKEIFSHKKLKYLVNEWFIMMPKVMLYQTINCRWKELFCNCETDIQTNTFNFTSYKFNEYLTCRRIHWKGVAFFQYLPSCNKLLFFPTKSLKKYLKLRYLEQKYDKRKNYFLYVFPKVQYLTDFTLSVERHVKLWSNKIKAPQNKYGRY